MSKLIKHLKKNRKRYLIADVAILENPLLSWRAKGLLLYLLNRPSKWIANDHDLVNRSTDGFRAIQTAKRELKNAGYLNIKQTVKGDWEWSVHETATCNNAISYDTEPHMRFRGDISNTDITKNKDDDYYDKIKERTRKEIGL
jgi:hypothetical protein